MNFVDKDRTTKVYIPVHPCYFNNVQAKEILCFQSFQGELMRKEQQQPQAANSVLPKFCQEISQE